MTFYLKYRPQRVEELDLTAVRDQLKKIIASADKPHAFLFCGPKGAGKTSTARILAKALNCENPSKTGEPCNKCALCIAITKGNCLDVIEMDAASHRGVEDVRSLRETIKLSPAGAKMKVYIIDEAHMLTTEAANALLKTLEEPPAHAMFILATTAPEKLPDTIRSRSTTINFSKGTQGEIVRSLQKVVDGEGLTAGKEVLEAIAKYADGSFREAHKLLEQLSLGSKEVSLVEVDKIGTSIDRSSEKLINLLAVKDVKQSIEEIENLVQEGVSLKAYSTQLISLLREELLAKLGLGKEKKYGLEVGELKQLLELFSGAIPKIPTSVIAQLPLELAVVEWCTDSNPLDPVSDKRNVRSQIRESSLKEEVEEESVNQNLPITIHQSRVTNMDEGVLEENWRKILEAARGKNFAIEALLKAARPSSFDGKNLQVEIFYRFHKEKLEKDPYRSIIEETALSILGGSSIRLVCILSSSRKKAADIKNITSTPDSELTKLAEEIFTNNPETGKVH